VKCERVDWYIVVFNKKTKLVYVNDSKGHKFSPELEYLIVICLATQFHNLLENFHVLEYALVMCLATQLHSLNNEDMFRLEYFLVAFLAKPITVAARSKA
jgi:hypothetical protein